MPGSYYNQNGKHHGGRESGEIGQKKELGVIENVRAVEMEDGQDWEV
jgi:hypothetical protein